MVSQNVSRMKFSHQMRDLWGFADRCNIPWNLPTNFHSDLIATIQQTYLLSLCALLSQQSHKFPICAVLTYIDSRKGLHRICQIPRNCQCKWLWISTSAPRTFASSFLFLVKFWFYTDMPGSIGWLGSCTTTAYRWLFRDSQPSLRTLRSAVIKSPKLSARSTAPPLRLQHGALVILVLWQISQFRSLGECV